MGVPKKKTHGWNIFHGKSPQKLDEQFWENPPFSETENPEKARKSEFPRLRAAELCRALATAAPVDCTALCSATKR